jgi:hypothetical protein
MALRNLTCIRCNVPLQFAGTKQFHEGSKWTEEFFGAWAQNSLVLDVYYCPTCGHVELLTQTRDV